MMYKGSLGIPSDVKKMRQYVEVVIDVFIFRYRFDKKKKIRIIQIFYESRVRILSYSMTSLVLKTILTYFKRRRWRTCTLSQERSGQNWSPTIPPLNLSTFGYAEGKTTVLLTAGASQQCAYAEKVQSLLGQSVYMYVFRLKSSSLTNNYRPEPEEISITKPRKN